MNKEAVQATFTMRRPKSALLQVSRAQRSDATDRGTGEPELRFAASGIWENFAVALQNTPLDCSQESGGRSANASSAVAAGGFLSAARCPAGDGERNARGDPRPSERDRYAEWHCGHEPHRELDHRAEDVKGRCRDGLLPRRAGNVEFTVIDEAEPGRSLT